jgi:hypothetical protein
MTVESHLETGEFDGRLTTATVDCDPSTVLRVVVSLSKGDCRQPTADC